LSRLFRPGPHDFVRVSVRARDTSGAETLTVKHLDEARSASLVRQAIMAAYKHGDVVIVGRGGQATLQKMEGVLHVRVEAPMQNRILRVQKRDGVTSEEARRLITQEDEASSQYLKRLFGIRWDDSTLYHLVINTGKWDMEPAAQLIANAVGYLKGEPAA
jgi:cytidylate kinase